MNERKIHGLADAVKRATIETSSGFALTIRVGAVEWMSTECQGGRLGCVLPI